MKTICKIFSLLMFLLTGFILLYSCSDPEQNYYIHDDQMLLIPYSNGQKVRFKNEKDSFVDFTVTVETGKIESNAAPKESREFKDAKLLPDNKDSLSSIECRLTADPGLSNFYIESFFLGSGDIVNYKFPNDRLWEVDGNYVTLLDSINISGFEYKNVFKFKGNISNMIKGPFCYFIYLARGYGIIRIEVTNGKYYNLVQ